MHTGIISFCDRIGYNIKCSDTKDIILNHLEHHYKIRIIQKHWYSVDDSQIPYIQKIPHSVSIRSNGNPYFLYFTRHEGVNQAMYIDKKVQPGYQKPRIILSKGLFHHSVFDNTLVEGEMVKDNRKQWLFIINDIIIYKGQSLAEKPLAERLACAYDLLTNHYTYDKIMNVCHFQIKKYVPATQQDIASLLLFSEKLPYTSRGLYFMPHSLKHKPKLINFDDNLIKSVVRKVKDEAGFIEAATLEPVQDVSVPVTTPSPPAAEPPPPPVLDEDTQELWLRKTEQPDVYDIYPQNNSLQKMGVASVPGLQTSKLLRATFKNINVATSVKFICKLDPTFNNWVPLYKV